VKDTRRADDGSWRGCGVARAEVLDELTDVGDQIAKGAAALVEHGLSGVDEFRESGWNVPFDEPFFAAVESVLGQATAVFGGVGVGSTEADEGPPGATAGLKEK
jgi:hypothetical protein